MAYELYNIPEGKTETKLNLTVSEVKWSNASEDISAHYNVIFKENTIMNFEDEEGNSIWILPNPAKSGSQDYEAAEKDNSIDLFYYFISNLDKKIEFTINYKVTGDYDYYSVEVDEKMLNTIKQEKSKWDKLGYTNKNEWVKGTREIKEKVDKVNETKGKEEDLAKEATGIINTDSTNKEKKYWDENIEKQFNMPEFSVNGLTKFKEAFESLTNKVNTFEEVQNHWGQIELGKQFGEKLEKEVLDKIKIELGKINSLTSIFPDNKIPADFEEQWKSLNNRPNITPEEYNNLKNSQKPSDYEEIKSTMSDQQDTITKRDNTIKQQEKEITNRDNTINDLRNQIKNLKAKQIPQVEIKGQ